jgi:hypothetical protein
MFQKALVNGKAASEWQIACSTTATAAALIEEIR